MNLQLFLWVILAANFALSFMAPGMGVRNAPWFNDPIRLRSLRNMDSGKQLFLSMHSQQPRHMARKLVQYAKSNEDSDANNEDAVDNFDGKGFAGYLAPYAFALLVSVGVTAAFIKFVLLDY